jgi:hypothetical protein
MVASLSRKLTLPSAEAEASALRVMVYFVGAAGFVVQSGASM